MVWITYFFDVIVVVWLAGAVYMAYHWSKTEYFKSCDADEKFISLLFCMEWPVFSLFMKIWPDMFGNKRTNDKDTQHSDECCTNC